MQNLEWLKDTAPWIQGLFGGAGATLLWEIALRPRRERRQVATVLAEEVAIGLEFAAGSRRMLDHQPIAIAADFSISTLAFSTISEKLGALPPELVGMAVLYYNHAETLNRLPAAFAVALDAFRKAEHEEPPQREQARRALEVQLYAYRTGLDSFVQRANELLSRLRRASVPLRRLDCVVRPKQVLKRDELEARVDALANKQRQDLDATYRALLLTTTLRSAV